jgi:hypothetical protein
VAIANVVTGEIGREGREFDMTPDAVDIVRIIAGQELFASVSGSSISKILGTIAVCY